MAHNFSCKEDTGDMKMPKTLMLLKFSNFRFDHQNIDKSITRTFRKLCAIKASSNKSLKRGSEMIKEA